MSSKQGQIVVLNADTLAEVARFDLPGPAYALTVNPGTGRIFTVDAVNDRLYVVEPVTGELGQINLPEQDAQDGGQGIAVRDNLVAVASYAAGNLTILSDAACADRLTPVPTEPATTPTSQPTNTPTATATRPSPTPDTIRAKVEIVWPHGGASVRDANLANITAYLIADTGPTLAPPSCAWSPTVRLWVTQNTQPATLVGIGQKRMFTTSGRTFPVWDFNDVNVNPARDSSNKLNFFVTVDGVRTLSNIWTHAIDARTIAPQQDVPAGTVARPPTSVDALIEIVWPHDSLPVEQAAKANITAFLFEAGTKLAIPPDLRDPINAQDWQPAIWLHRSLNADAEKDAPVRGQPRTVTTANGVRFLAWDFNDIDVSAARTSTNKVYFWLSVDGVAASSNIWAHGSDARTVLPQMDLLDSCR